MTQTKRLLKRKQKDAGEHQNSVEGRMLVCIGDIGQNSVEGRMVVCIGEKGQNRVVGRMAGLAATGLVAGLIRRARLGREKREKKDHHHQKDRLRAMPAMRSLLHLLDFG